MIEHHAGDHGESALYQHNSAYLLLFCNSLESCMKQHQVTRLSFFAVRTRTIHTVTTGCLCPTAGQKRLLFVGRRQRIPAGCSTCGGALMPHKHILKHSLSRLRWAPGAPLPFYCVLCAALPERFAAGHYVCKIRSLQLSRGSLVPLSVLFG